MVEKAGRFTRWVWRHERPLTIAAVIGATPALALVGYYLAKFGVSATVGVSPWAGALGAVTGWSVYLWVARADLFP